MKKFLLAGVALAALTGTAFAADLPSRKGAVMAPMAPIFTWTGFYVGANIGYVAGESRYSDLSRYNGALSSPRYTSREGGVFGGGQLGYNYQMGAFVLGAELDLGYMGIDAKRVQPGSPNNDTVGRIESGFYGALTARAGYAVDRFLVYAKGGAAYLDARSSVTDACNVGACGAALIAARSSSDRWGWTIGGGVEYAFTNNLTAKVEYQYFDFGKERFTGVSNFGVPYRFSNDFTAHTVKVGVNYKF